MSYKSGDTDNPVKPLKWYKKLAAGKWRLAAEAFLAEGERVISQIATSSPDRIIEILSTRPLPACFSSYPSRPVTEDQLRYISSSKTPQGIIAVVRMPMETLLCRTAAAYRQKSTSAGRYPGPGQSGQPHPHRSGF